MNGRLQIETVSSLALKDNPLGDPRRREVPVYLPPSYGVKRGRRYPVIFYLPGFAGTGRGSVNDNPWKENVAERLDRLIATGRARETILVVPDCFTSFGGSQYVNSEATGRYGDHILRELVGWIEDKFAAVRRPAGRAVLGKSSGGFGALTLAMRHPEVFGHCASHSGDMGFEVCYGGDLLKLCVELEKYGRSVQRFLAEFRRRRDKSGFDFGALNALGMAACYSPNAKSAFGFDLPVDLRTGERIPAVWSRWAAWDPVLACVKNAARLSRLETLWFDAGVRDEFFLHMGARRLSDALGRLGVKHTYEEHDRGHFNMEERLDVSLALLTRRCARAA